MSPPAEKARPPAAVNDDARDRRIAAPLHELAASARAPSTSVTAFSAFGRFSVTMTGCAAAFEQDFGLGVVHGGMS